MTDQEIIDLFFARSEQALDAVQRKYGAWCRRIAENILGGPQDAEECLSDCWLLLWNAIPPARPEHFQGYLGAVVRNRALLLRSRRARGPDTVELAALELADCLPPQDGPERRAEAAELGRAISAFLESQPQAVRTVFLRRYWYADSAAAIAARLGWSQVRTRSALFRARKKLKAYLKQEGFL
nr:sigma-70 family RNA polymerase sigma factor [uncultured Oscillibacter sp.]